MKQEEAMKLFWDLLFERHDKKGKGAYVTQSEFQQVLSEKHGLSKGHARLLFTDTIEQLSKEKKVCDATGEFGEVLGYRVTTLAYKNSLDGNLPFAKFEAKKEELAQAILNFLCRTFDENESDVYISENGLSKFLSEHFSVSIGQAELLLLDAIKKLSADGAIEKLPRGDISVYKATTSSYRNWLEKKD